ncbi:glycoside hydrolase family 3 protein [Rhizomonospora bruguierae]|uniref:glycoside hydrolase family 3 protein n=1 Tax=Rhizomonospora bruguierae TaxID=1581705 RepID=UPI0024BED4A1|nr:glycoside hydrolase family 3 protein [Micromonospora sp. NBRC 107566]
MGAAPSSHPANHPGHLARYEASTAAGHKAGPASTAAGRTNRPGGEAGHADLPFRDPSRPPRERVADLLGRLTLAEKVALLHQYQAPVPRLGVGAFRTGTEALHGLAWLGPATVFPQAVGLATTWNPDLVRAVGNAVGNETRGFHHKDPTGAGLNVWAPVVNPLRDPRWGRNEEGYAEDPWLTGVLATAYARGLRGDHPTYLKTAPTLKHFLGYNNETDRCVTSSNLPPRVLREYELPAYRPAIEAGAAVAVMPSYNLVNGRPAHVSPLINAELRRWTGDDLLVVSDAYAPSNLAGTQRYFADDPAAYAAAVRAGLDSFTQDDADSAAVTARLTEALERGLLDESDVDEAARHALSIRFRLGEFDPPEWNPYAAITEEVINCAAHRELAREAARQSIVLLKNDGLLPVGQRRIAVIGPLADTLYEDWYSGTLPYGVTALAGLRERLPDAEITFAEGLDRVALRVGADGPYVTATEAPMGGPLQTGGDAGGGFDLFDWGQRVYALRSVANGMHVSVDERGVLVNNQPRPNGWVVKETFRLVDHDGGVALCHLASNRYVRVDGGTLTATAEAPRDAAVFTVDLVSGGVESAAAVAREADVAIVVVGNNPMVNGRETEDRADLELPPGHETLVRAVAEANPRTALVVTSSYPYAIGRAQERVPAVLWSAHGGQEFGHALAAVLCGDADPSGRLTQTWYRSAADLPDLLDYDIIGAETTYMYYRGTPLYPFGHGLSYTTFEYRDLRVERAGEAVRVAVEVANTGDRAGDEVVQLYTRQRGSRVKQPVRRLRGFRRISLPPGGSTTVELAFRERDLAIWDVTRRRWAVEEARHEILVGRSAADIRRAATIEVAGETIPPRRVLGAALEAIDHDDQSGVLLREETPAAGEAVESADPGAWLAFEAVDLTGVGGFTALVARADQAPARLVLRVDDPLSGAVVAELAVPCTSGRHAWAEVHGRLCGPGGVRDLYVVFEAAGIGLSRLICAAGPA